MGYSYAVLREYVKLSGHEIIIISWDNGQTHFKPKNEKGITNYARSSFSTDKIYNLLAEVKPIGIYISGWMDKGYINAVANYKAGNKGTTVITGLDNQYVGSFRQKLGSIYFKFKYKSFIDYAWVPGIKQYQFALQLGFKKKSILKNLYSADLTNFNTMSTHSKRFVYVGRFTEIKNVQRLMDAFKRINTKQRKNWELVLIGNGHLDVEMQKNKIEGIEIMNFLQPPELAKELSKGGVFVLPSISEPWGVVVHELAALGYPMILSKNCGAAEVFLDGNGILINPMSTDSIKNAMIQFMEKDDYELELMKKKSVQLSTIITPIKSAVTLFNALMQ